MISFLALTKLSGFLNKTGGIHFSVAVFVAACAGINGGSLAACAGLRGGCLAAGAGMSCGGLAAGAGMSGGGLGELVATADSSLTSDSSVEREWVVVLMCLWLSALEGC